MNLRSIELITELGLAATRGKIHDRGNYLVVETPDDPSYYYGNVLVLPEAPRAGEVERWTSTFAAELGTDPRIRHVTLRWDGTAGELGAAAELRAAGFTIDASTVMISERVLAPARADVRRLTTAEMPSLVELAWAITDRHDDENRQFLQRRTRWHRSLVERGIAWFWGAYAPNLVASVGIVKLGSIAGSGFAGPRSAAEGRGEGSIGRFQDVMTLPAHRRRGLAGALLATAAGDAFAAGVERVAIVADPGGAAARVYERVGFRAIEHTASACRYPSGVRPSRAR